jgi:hypothetical protein
VYGNKDLTFASKAFLFVDKCVKELNNLPSEYKNFYLRRLIIKLEESVNSDSKFN